MEENLVASPRQSGSNPVAIGSNVPVCPHFAAEKSRLIDWTAWLEEAPKALSNNKTPLMFRRAIF